MLGSLVRGYMLQEVMHTVVGVDSYDEAFNKAMQALVTGLPAFASSGCGRPLQRELADAADQEVRSAFVYRGR
ncbi:MULTISPECIES: hypothetical protein [unclassified Bradyrhizobium]|uniref:hypothetical protein n=1 Tax=unclassified Bradyrhizobium TaxID=2631580 RepID=UPI00244BF237|nr:MULTISPECIES: hypothetical protein [unclassified Bradyrhizobium]MDH2347171.1 hypothetical protein [Bradyrhizobium sp. SSUT77]MDH2356350.1 hypothetical protein [Bradyrhizobium sp. SSUT112]